MKAQLAAWACVLAAVAAPRAAPLAEPWQVPRDPQEAREQSDAYAWRLFVAVNWPADPALRAADPRRALGADAPVVWETWQNAVEVFRDDGADPGPWAPAMVPEPAGAQRFEFSSLKELANLRHVEHGRMVDVTDPIAVSRRLTEVRLNRASYEYLRAHALYNVEGQLQAVAQGPVAFPEDAVHVKAQWRPIAAADRGRYHTLEVTLADGRTQLYGLTALHLSAKVLAQWFWATFEHSDNERRPDGDGWRLPSRDALACPQAPVGCGRAPQALGLAGTVWANYRLRGTMTRFLAADGTPARLANSELEAGMQEHASCMTCHARASIGSANGQVLRLPVFAAVLARPEGGFERRGYVGTPDPAWFADPREGAAALRPLDFVWSLSQAKSRRKS